MAHSPPPSSLPPSSLLDVHQNADGRGVGESQTTASSRTKLLLLGTGTPNLEPDRYQSASVIVVDQTPYLIDCGAGMLHRWTEARAKYRPASRCRRNSDRASSQEQQQQRDISTTTNEDQAQQQQSQTTNDHHWTDALCLCNLRAVFVTHLHPDHTTGLPSLLFTKMSDTNTVTTTTADRNVMHIYGPYQTKVLVDGVIQAYRRAAGMDSPSDGTVSSSIMNVTVTEIDQPGVIYQDDLITVTAFAVEHAGYGAFGFRFQTPDKVIVISGDTTYLPAMGDNYARHADILVHEVYSAAGFQRVPTEWQQYHVLAHTSTEQLAAVAKVARPKLLVLTHHLPFGNSLESLVDEVKERYADGPVACGHDLDLFE